MKLVKIWELTSYLHRRLPREHQPPADAGQRIGHQKNFNIPQNGAAGGASGSGMDGVVPLSATSFPPRQSNQKRFKTLLVRRRMESIQRVQFGTSESETSTPKITKIQWGLRATYTKKMATFFPTILLAIRKIKHTGQTLRHPAACLIHSFSFKPSTDAKWRACLPGSLLP